MNQNIIHFVHKKDESNKNSHWLIKNNQASTNYHKTKIKQKKNHFLTSSPPFDFLVMSHRFKINKNNIRESILIPMIKNLNPSQRFHKKLL
jgi:UDP-glucose 6-dehydrogenase